jgi:hypothetical protein
MVCLYTICYNFLLFHVTLETSNNGRMIDSVIRVMFDYHTLYGLVGTTYT